MTERNLINCLESYQTTKKRIENLEDEIFRLKSIAMSLGDSIGSGMPSAHNVSNAKYTKAIESLADIETEHLNEIASLKDALSITEKYIKLERAQHRRIILQMQYIDGLSISKIARQIERSPQTVYKIRKSSIKDILKYINRVEV